MDFNLAGRTQVTAFPAAYLRANKTDRVTAVDVMPNGAPAEIPGEGFAWFDAVDTDCSVTDPPMRGARMGITSAAAVFASRRFNGAAILPLHLEVDTTVVLNATTAIVTLPVPVQATSAEGLRTANDAAFISFYNTANATRSGYLQMTAAGNATLNVEINQALEIRTNNTPRMTILAAGTVRMEQPMRLRAYTVATLPAGAQGDVAYVTDALAPAYNAALVGGGAVAVKAFFNGAAWVAG